MAKFKPTNIKGADDLFGNAFKMKNDIVNLLKVSFERYGYQPLETSQLNYLETLTYKYEDNAEIVKEIYKLKDQGDRDLGLRYDLTVPFCKFIAMNRNLKMPFRRYEIGKVWRNGPVKAGRLREFYQCDIDVVGDKSIAVEAEMIVMAVGVYKQIGIEPIVEYGNRKLLTQILQSVGVEDKNIASVIGIVDKMKKITEAELTAELSKYMPKENVGKLLMAFKNPPKTNEIVELERLLRVYGVNDNCVFAPHLARGLNVYTGTVWEIFDKERRITSSLGGGGRYDRIITEWIDNGQEYPAVGMSFGLEPIMKVLEQANNAKYNDSRVWLMVVPMCESNKTLEMLRELREKWFGVLVWNEGRVGKAFEYADKENIPCVIVVGEKEIASGKIQIKDMRSGNTKEFKMDDFSKIGKYVSDIAMGDNK